MAANLQPIAMPPGRLTGIASAFSLAELRADLRAQAQAAAERMQLTLAEAMNRGAH